MSLEKLSKLSVRMRPENIPKMSLKMPSGPSDLATVPPNARAMPGRRPHRLQIAVSHMLGQMVGGMHRADVIHVVLAPVCPNRICSQVRKPDLGQPARTPKGAQSVQARPSSRRPPPDLVECVAHAIVCRHCCRNAAQVTFPPDSEGE